MQQVKYSKLRGVECEAVNADRHTVSEAGGHATV